MSGIAPLASAASTPVFASDATRPIEMTSLPAEGVSHPSGPGSTEPLGSFGSFLGNAVEEANRLDHAASQKVEALAAGATDDLHGTMISVKEADISIKLVGTVRNKILDAFQELWRTSV